MLYMRRGSDDTKVTKQKLSKIKKVTKQQQRKTKAETTQLDT